MDALERVAQRGPHEHDGAVPQRVADLRVLLAAGGRRPADELRVGVERPYDHRVVLDVGRGDGARVVEDRQDLAAEVLRLEVDDARVDLLRSLHDPRVELVVRAVAEPSRDRRGVVAQLAQLGVDEVPLERRNDDEVREQQRTGDDDGKRKGEPPADASQRVHLSRKR